MASVELRDKNENLVISEDDWIFTQRASSPFAVEKLKMETLLDYIIPIGTRIMYDGATTPANFLYCDGSAVSRSTYADLFAVIGTQFGVGDGSTTFNIPNLQGLSPKGIGDAIISGRTKTGPVSLGEVQEDQFQAWQLGSTEDDSGARNYYGKIANRDREAMSVTSSGQGLIKYHSAFQGVAQRLKAMNDGTNGTPRTGLATRDSTMGTKFYIRYK